MPTYSSVLAWRMPWTEEPGGLQSMGSQRVGLDLATERQQHIILMYFNLKTGTFFFLPIRKRERKKTHLIKIHTLTGQQGR